MYNGYPEDHMCYGCGCLKRDNGYRFCGKKLPGMGTIGCSDRWECRNCKNCESGNNNNFNKCYLFKILNNIFYLLFFLVK